LPKVLGGGQDCRCAAPPQAGQDGPELVCPASPSLLQAHREPQEF
jgi:hypothetical protein